MNENFIIVFGSAVTKNYRSGRYLPSDIDVISDMEEKDVIRLVTEWGKSEFHALLAVDLHRPEGSDCVRVPVLFKHEMEEGKGYLILYGNPKVRTYIRDRGFASILRMYGNNPDDLMEKLRNPRKLSLLPETETYSGKEGEDKYYSGLKAFRNAAAHVDNLDEILSRLNCGNLLKLLLYRDADNWKASPDITDNPLPYGDGWTHAVTVHVSSVKTEPVLRGWDWVELEEIIRNEKEAIRILFKEVN